MIEVLGDVYELASEGNIKLALDKSKVNLGQLIRESTAFINETLQGEGDLSRGTTSR